MLYSHSFKMFSEYPGHRSHSHPPLLKAKSTASLYSVFAPVTRRNTPSPTPTGNSNGGGSSDDESLAANYSSRRPLPQPPQNLNTLTVPGSNPRPLPKPPVDCAVRPNANASQSSFHSINSTHSTYSPLESTSASASSSPYPSSTPASSHASSLVDISDRTLQLEIPPFEPLDVMDVHIRSPSTTSPVSPIIFAFPPMSPDLFRKRESALAERMMELGFVEQVQVQSRSQSRASPSPSPSYSFSPSPSPSPCPSRMSSRHDEIDSEATAEAHDEDHEVVLLLDLQHEPERAQNAETRENQRPVYHHPYHHAAEKTSPDTSKVRSGIHNSSPAAITAPPVPAPVVQDGGQQTKAKRFSRKWVREKKGKRWVEKDYEEVLQALRKLR